MREPRGRRAAADYLARNRADRPDETPKPRPELVPARAVLAVASVMAAGEPEHGDRWRRHPAAHHVGGALRHLLRWCAGEGHDHDLHAQGHGKHSHLACAAARALMALDAEITAKRDRTR
jgi:hypothetical protein